ncbi:unnamed protein product [Durusdinium trenchii]|uniref:Uncharacterized protein n=2 Tax=Durusdinium trenchii TaxID=1381693 RepID=A0ABP0NDR1_9DINO
MAEMVARPTEYMYQDPPTVLVCLWCSGIFCATVTIAITVYNIRSHYHSAREQGLGHHEMLPSFGARADRIMQLLLVPLVGASTAALQMFLPGGAPILSFLRVYQFTRAMQDLVEFLFLLNGSQQHILDSLPKEKITLFSKFPLCCVFGWSCCAHRPRLGHLRFFVAGIRQFNWLMPLLGVISVYMESQNYPYDDPIETVCRTLTTVSTFFAMWAFKCLLPLMTYSITATTVDPDRIAHMERRGETMRDGNIHRWKWREEVMATSA